mgnify:CR=1 FL=1
MRKKRLLRYGNKVNKLISKINADEYDALAIPGGDYLYGYFEEAYDERFLELIRAFNAKNKVIASVCVASLPIGKSGALTGRKGTSYHLQDGYRQKELQAFGVTLVNEPIVTDGNIITSYCPETAPRVAFALLKRLLGEDTVTTIKRGMGFSV